MPKYAKLPDGQYLSFPDETTEEVMSKAVRSHMGIKDQSLIGKVGETALGIGDAALEMFTGGIALPIAGLIGGAHAAGSGAEKGAKTIEKVQEKLTVPATTETGKKIVETIGNFFEKGKTGLQESSVENLKKNIYTLYPDWDQKSESEKQMILDKESITSGAVYDVALNAGPLLFGLGAARARAGKGLSPEAQAELARRQGPPGEPTPVPAPVEPTVPPRSLDSPMQGLRDLAKDQPRFDATQQGLRDFEAKYGPEARARAELEYRRGPEGEQLKLFDEDPNNVSRPTAPPLPERTNVRQGELFPELTTIPKPPAEALIRPGEVARPLESVVQEQRAMNLAPEEMQRSLQEQIKRQQEQVRLQEENSRILEQPKGRLEEAYFEKNVPIIEDLKLKQEGLKEQKALVSDPEIIRKIDETLDQNSKKLGELSEKTGKFISEERKPVFDQNKPFSFVPKKERGSISFFQQDPKFIKFKESLPKHLQKEAKAMWEVAKQRGITDTIDMTPNQGVAKATAEIPGVKEALKGIEDRNVPWEQVREQALKEENPSLRMAGRNLMSGGRMAGWVTQNTAIQYAAQTVNNAMRNVMKVLDHDIANKSTGLKTLLQKLNSKELATLHAKMLDVEGKGVLTREKLLSEGFNEKSIKAFERYREVMDKTFELINSTRQELGLKPLEKRLSYIPSRFLGDFQFLVKDQTGSVVHVVGGKTRWAAESAKKFMQEKHPDFKFEKIEHFGRKGSSVQNAYHQLLGILDEADPRVQALETTYKDWLDKGTYDYMNMKRHFEAKKGVGGAEGMKEWRTAEQNAKEGFEASLRYVEQMTKWAELQKAGQTVNKILADTELAAKQPAAVKYIRDYWDAINGRNGKIADAINDIVDTTGQITGIGGTSAANAIASMKYWMTLKFLANGAFWASQLLQPIQSVPGWLVYLKGQGLKGSMIKAQMDAAQEFAPGLRTPAGEAALNWAKKESVLKSHILDDIRPKGQFSPVEGLKNFTDKIMTWPEETARTVAYMSYVKMLENSGIKGTRAYQTAANLVDASMTDYKLHERPLMYQKAGIAGELMSPLTTYKHNQYTQMYGMLKNKEYAMATTAASTQLFMAGIAGFYGLQEIDAVIKWMNTMASQNGWGIDKIDGVQERLVKMVQKNPGKTSEFLALGGVSQVTGMDVSSKFSAANVLPDTPMDFIMPYFKDIETMAGSTSKALMNPTKQNVMDALHDVAPSALKVVPEWMNTEKGVTQLFGKQGGDVKRNDFDWFARALSTRSIKESMEQQGTRMAKDEIKLEVEKRKAILQKFNENPSAELATRYIHEGGSPQQLMSSNKKYELNKVLTELERTKGLSPTTLQAMRKYMKADEYERRKQ